MKAILEFNLPEDNSDFDIASKAMSWALAMQDLDNFLRQKLKYEEAGEDYEVVRKELREILDNYTINLNSIT